MKRIVELSNYQLRVYFKSSRFVMPFIVTVVFLAVLYSSRPVSIESSFALTCFLLFGVMAWAGYTFPSGEDTVMEQILFLRVKSGLLLSVIRGPLVREIPFLRALFWVLPPVEGAASVYMGTQDALPARLTGYFAALFLYGVVYCVVKSLICFYKKI